MFNKQRYTIFFSILKHVEQKGISILYRRKFSMRWFSNLGVKLILLILLSSSQVMSTAHASDENNGLRIATEMKSRNTGWVNSQSDIIMTLRSRSGQEVVLSLIHI